MALLRAFVDDSASENGDKRLFMAGYLNAARQWSLFSEAWREELIAAPSIEHLKMAEANSLRSQFNGWSDRARKEKLHGLARVVRHFKPMSFEVSLSREQYYRLVKPVAPRALNPHFIASFAVISSLARFAAEEKFAAPIKFSFDQQDGVSSDLGLFFDHMILDLPRRARKLISGRPAFENDKFSMPLQAADMLVWHLRREHELGLTRGELPMANALRSERHLQVEIPETYLDNWAKRFSTIRGNLPAESKREWKLLKKEIVRLQVLGFIPPHGNRWKNAFYALRKSLIRQTGPNAG